ncbi:MAG: hypothetical protein HKO85_03885 [Xanthomonadales bacterium]|nr:hypothetical protein [Xanthomonadales bacterium]
MNIEFDKSLGGSRLKLWLTWALCCSLILAVILPGLHLWPAVLQDEVQIIDLGRAFLNPNTDWSITWSLVGGQANITPFYLGVIPQAIAYTLTEPSNYGPRLWSTFGAIMASGLLMSWSLYRRTPKWAALVIAFVFLLDPIFNYSYRQGRSDSWALAAIIGACLLLRIVIERKKSKQNCKLPLFSSGMLTSLSLFVWPTTAALFPLVFLELFYVGRTGVNSTLERQFSSFRHVVVWFCLGGVVSAVVLLLPIIHRWEFIAALWGTDFRVQSYAAHIQYSIIGMYAIRNPMIVIAIATALLIRREYGLIFATAVSLFMMSFTMIYPMRILYLLPYLVAILAGAYSQVAQDRSIRWRHATLVCVTALLLAWCAHISLIKRPVIAISQELSRSPQQIYQLMKDTIGEGEFRVLLVEWEMYYAARQLGWKPYKLFGRIDRKSAGFSAFLDKMDYVIVRDKLIFKKEIRIQDLHDSGFEMLKTVSFPKPDQTIFEWGPYRIETTNAIYEDVMIFKNTK